MAQENGFRPSTLDELVGQPKIQQQLSIYIKASKMKHQPLEHVLITGFSGGGKTTIAYIIAHELGVDMHEYSGPAISSVEDMAEILVNLNRGDILFIDEIQKLPKKVQQMMYTAMEQFVADVTIDGEPQRIPIAKFTLVACTDQYGQLTNAMMNRFPIQLKLMPYDKGTIAGIVRSAAKAQGITIDDECCLMIAGATRGVPRNANSYLRRIYDFALVLNDGKIDKDLVEVAFDMMGISKDGLDADQMAYVKFLSGKVKPVGVATIALSIGIDKATIELAVEPYLLQERYVIKASRGRVLTERGRALTADPLAN